MPLELEIATPDEVIHSGDQTLVELVDGLLRHGVVVRGEVWLTVADIDLVFLGVDLLLTAPDKMKTAPV